MCPPENNSRLQMAVLIDVATSSEGERPVMESQAKKVNVRKPNHFDWTSYLLITIIIVITTACYPWKQKEELLDTSIYTVCYCAWLTAVSTGFGVLPFYLTSKPNKFWTGISNAGAGGMMCAASLTLAYEGFSEAHLPGRYPAIHPKFLTLLKSEALSISHPGYRVAFGVLCGIIFILIVKKVLEGYEDLHIGNLGHMNSEKVLLMMCVMTLHSFSEGVGIGVAFGGPRGAQLGKFISLSLGAHNVPEGVAVGVVMTSSGFSVAQSVLWAIFSSLPQPLMAVPAYLFVEQFSSVLAVGLGFAAGAMAYVAIFELLQEAIEDTKSLLWTAVTCIAAFGVMLYFQQAVKDNF